MRFTFNWLLDYLETDYSVQKISQTLTFAGVEVESIIDNREKLKGFEIVYIKSIQKHPNAHKLKICEIETSVGLRTVVCGAKNVKHDVFAIWAPPGVTIPLSNMKIDIMHIRGEMSCGMLCSLHELGLEDQSEGIYLLNEHCFVGKNACNVLKDFLDPVFDVSLTPNRIDCAGVFGIARLLSACGVGTLKIKNSFYVDSCFPSPIEWKIESGATFVAGCYIRGVKNVSSPDWIQKRLKAIGLKPKSALVDIINYILFDQNRPLHVYDADKLQGNTLIIKQLDNPFLFQTLKMDTCFLMPGDIVIYDREPIALAGIIGGKNTSVTNETTNIFIESAIFDKKFIGTTTNRLLLRTDSGYRFERGIDPESTLSGLNFAINLIQDICGGLASTISIQDKRRDSKCKNTLSILKKQFESMVGIEHAWDDFLAVLKKLDYEIISFNTQKLTVIPPSYRSDADNIYVLIEDYIRVRGMHTIHNSILSFNKKTSTIVVDHDYISLKKCMAGRGFIENIGFTFSNRETCVLLENAISITNPINIEYSYMRQTLVFSLVFSALENWKKNLTNIRLFEVGLIFDKNFVNKQQQSIAGILMGGAQPCWKKNVFPYDVYDIKAEMIYFLHSIGYDPDLIPMNDELPFYYHPQRSMGIFVENHFIGFIGQLHPNIFGTKENVQAFIFEIFLDVVPPVHFSEIPFRKQFLPCVQRDFSFIFDYNIFAATVKKSIESSVPDFISKVLIFDAFNLQNGKKSLAFRVFFTPKDKTFTSNEIDVMSQKIIFSVEKLGGLLRKE